MSIVISGTTNDILVNGVSVATDAEVSSAVASGVASKANTADLKEIGVAQTWQDVTASRINLTTYTNTTGKPIMVHVVSSYSGNADMRLYVGGVLVSAFAINSTVQAQWTASAIVPNNTTYSIDKADSPSFTWYELR